MAANEIKPYDTADSKTRQVEAMFNNIAPTYDLLNHLLSLGIDRWWRRIAINHVRKNYRGASPLNILDVATGTGDFALLAQRKLNPQWVVGCDIADEMLRRAKAKAAERGLTDRVGFRHADCAHLPFPDSEFDVVLSAFALRNFADLDRCLSEIHRVMSPGGMAVIIDLCAPRRFPMRQLFSLYQHCIMPLMGRLMAHDRDAYSYLPRTMAAIPQGEDMAQHFRQAGFTRVTYRYLPFGMCCMYVGGN